MTIDEMEFVDAVISIPKNAISITLDVKTYENGVIQNVGAEFDASDIREMINLFEKTEVGEYPKYVFTEKGKQLLQVLDEVSE